MSIVKIENPLAAPVDLGFADTYGRQNSLFPKFVKGYRKIRMGQVVFPGQTSEAPAVLRDSIFDYNGELYHVDEDMELYRHARNSGGLAPVPVSWNNPIYVYYSPTAISVSNSGIDLFFGCLESRAGFDYDKEKKGYYNKDDRMLIDIVSSYSVNNPTDAVFESMRQVHRGHIYLNATEIDPKDYFNLWDITYGEFINEQNAKYLCVNELKEFY